MTIKIAEKQEIFEFGENTEKKIWIKLWNNKYFYENFNLNFSLQNKQLQTNLFSKKTKFASKTKQKQKTKKDGKKSLT